MYFYSISIFVGAFFILNIFADIRSVCTQVHSLKTSSLHHTKHSKVLLKALDSDEIDDDDDDDDDEDYDADDSDETEEIPHRHTHLRNVTIIKRVGITYAWGRWEKWSRCTNTCVQIRKRKCIQRTQNDTNSEAIDISFYPGIQNRTGCFGITKRYRSCKDEKCKPANKQTRDEQCANYNTTTSDWQSDIEEHNECELFCHPMNVHFYVSMNRSVIDGTPCEKPAIYYTHAYRQNAVCVEGICKAVHTSGAIRPATTSDSPLKCGSVLCHVVSEIFSKAKLNHGYNYVATIPAGAMNLTIKQMSRSENLLALKSTDDIFIVNGNNRASESGIYEYNDDSYEYNRDISTITSNGPINRAIILLLYVRGINIGVKYDYMLPVASTSLNEDEELQSQWNELGQPLDEVDDNNVDGPAAAQVSRVKERKRRKFSWKLLGFGECNRSCGPGVQPPIFRCIRDSPTRYYSPKRCASVEKPVFSEDIYHCNRGLCPAYWRSGDYSECKCDDGTLEGLRTRHVVCVQEQITGKVEEVNESVCEGEKLPELTETCNCPKSVRRKMYPRTPDRTTQRIYSRLVGAPGAVRTVHNFSTPLRRNLRDDRIDKTGVWLMSVWNQQCSEECTNTGFEYRSIYCDRTPPYTDLCDLRYTPEQKRVCSGHGQQCAKGVWFTSQWSNCTGDCFSLQRKRMVVCLRNGIVVNDSQCSNVKKPKDATNCTHTDVNFCGSKWHYSDWSECSRTCGEGIQRRYAKCLEYDRKQNAMIESSKCKYLDREPVYGACNVQKCEELQNASLNVVQKSNIEDDDYGSEEDDCNDEFDNCKRMNRQRLCKLDYYKTNCCQTCNGYN